MMVRGKRIFHKKQKKGFTLVELIAVIIIIGVLLLIIIPNVSGIIKRAEQKTFTASAKGVLRAATDYFANDDFTVEEGTCVNADSGKVSFDKDYQIKGGQICYIDGVSYLKRVTDGKYCASGNSDNLTVKLCGDTVTVTFNVESAFNDYFGYMESKDDHIFLANSNDFADSSYSGYGSGDITPFKIEVTIGDTLGDYISSYKGTGNVSYYYNGTSYNVNESFYDFWNITDSSLCTCKAVVPALWDKTFDDNTVITENTTFNVLSLGTTSSGNVG